MNLLVSKTLLICLLVLAVRSARASHHAGVNTTCVQEVMDSFNDKVKEVNEMLERVSLGEGATLYKCPDGHIHIDHGASVYTKEDNSTEVRRQIRTEGNIVKTISSSGPSGHTEVGIEKDGGLFLNITNSTINCKISVQTEEVHGAIILHPVFFTLAFSPDGRYVIYLAERLKDKSQDWSPYVANKGGLWMGTKYKVWRPK